MDQADFISNKTARQGDLAPREDGPEELKAILAKMQAEGKVPPGMRAIPRDIRTRKAATPNTLSVVTTVYHRHAGQDPTSLDERWFAKLDSKEQPWVRRLTLDKDWERLDEGWVDRASMLFITNDEGKHLPNLTPEEKVELEGRVVEIGVKVRGQDWVQMIANVRPTRCCLFEPEDLHDLRIRSMSGLTVCTVAIFPR